MPDKISEKSRPFSEWLELAHQGDPEAQVRVAIRYKFSGKTEAERSSWRDWALKSAAQDFLAAQAFLAQVAVVEKDYSDALPLLEKLAVKDHGWALAALATSHMQGRGVPIDQEKGYELYLRAAHIAPIYAAFQLAKCYSEGMGTVPDTLAANYWFQVAGDNGNDVAALCIGLCHWMGKDPGVQLSEAIFWYQNESTGSIRTLQDFLILKSSDHMTSDSLAESLKRFTNASNNENPTAQTILGIWLALGLAGAVDLTEASTWLDKAGMNGNQLALQITKNNWVASLAQEQDSLQPCLWFGMARR